MINLNENLPSVLIVTAEVLNKSHGTGSLLLRYFENYPQELIGSVFRVERGASCIKRSMILRESNSWVADSFLKDQNFSDFTPKIIYCAPVKESDLKILGAAATAYPDSIIVLHFMDYMPGSVLVFDDLVRELMPKVGAIWGLSRSLCEMLQRKYGRDVEHVEALHQMNWIHQQRDSQPFSAGFRAMMLGNFHNREVIPLLREAWALCMSRLPDLGPILWYCHPMRRQALLDAGVTIEPELSWQGFRVGEELQNVLLASDLAILPFNATAKVTGDYERYSLPSRIAEYAGAGLPTFAIASEDTEIGRLVSGGLGQLGVGPDAKAVADSLSSFILNREARARCSQKAREYSQELGVRSCTFGDWLKNRFIELVRF